jgi:excisionase family DNA binding protein
VTIAATAEPEVEPGAVGKAVDPVLLLTADSRRDAPSDDDVLVAPEVARLLRMNLKTVYELAKAGELPCWRLGRHFRFSRRAIVSRLGQCKPASHRKGQ